MNVTAEEKKLETPLKLEGSAIQQKVDRHEVDLQNLQTTFDKLEKESKDRIDKLEKESKDRIDSRAREILIYVGLAFILFVGGIVVEVVLFHTRNNDWDYINKMAEIKTEYNLMKDDTNVLKGNVNILEDSLNKHLRGLKK